MRTFTPALLNQPLDASQEFVRLENTFFLAKRLAEYDPDTGQGLLEWTRASRRAAITFNQAVPTTIPAEAQDFPPPADRQSRLTPFEISFITPRTIRVRLSALPEGRSTIQHPSPSLMLVNEPGRDDSWLPYHDDKVSTYTGEYGRLNLEHDPWHIDLRSSDGRLLTRTVCFGDTPSLQNFEPTPFSFVRSERDLHYTFAVSFSLAPDEKLFGTGESFTRLNKRGQKLNLCTYDAHGVQSQDMYKPIPFFLSSRGYGMFVHTSAPLTFDFGHDFDGAMVVYAADSLLDLFLFIGELKDILSEYIALTGRSPLPPLWSFGLWMSRITYKSEDEVRSVASDLRQHRIPCDVIHLDTGWFENDWLCDYQFSPTRFPDPAGMLADLKRDGFRLSLWQLPYFKPQNPLYAEIVAKGLAVQAADGNVTSEDAVLDFSNPNTMVWYQEKLAGLLKMGVSAIKVDFGEASPLEGIYASGRSGFYEHNLYPLRYNQAAAEITHQITGEWIIWARSAWAGSQRYPLHWGGDAENTDSGMAATLRGGLSFGLSGFPFWSHDIGGFVTRTPRQLYRRWLPFGMLTSHSRCHGQPPKEPWGYDPQFVADFRRAVELKYHLMPYVYAQAASCSQTGFPLLRTLFFEYPHDPTSWLIEDEYFFGTDLLVAPLFEETDHRQVYLPPGEWFDFQTGILYPGAVWQDIQAGIIPIILLVRSGAILPHIQPAQSTAFMDWSQIELRVYGNHPTSEGLICLPGEPELHNLSIDLTTDPPVLLTDPFQGRVHLKITHVEESGTI